MNSIWAGSIDGAFFDMDKFDMHRTLQVATYEANKKDSNKAYYVLGVDVGRFGCTTEVVVMKVTPSTTGVNNKQIVNIFTYDAEHFGEQSIHIKRLYHKYKCRIVVVDGNGLGSGLVDWLVMDQEDPDTGESLGAMGVYNDPEGIYKKFLSNSVYPIPNSLYVMKANVSINSELYSYCQTQLSAGKLQFLIDENAAKAKLNDPNIAKGKNWSRNKKAEYLRPYVLTSVLREQMSNLIEDSEGANVRLKQSNRTIKKDKVSALIYALWWTMNEERRGSKKRFGDMSKLMLFSKH